MGHRGAELLVFLVLNMALFAIYSGLFILLRPVFGGKAKGYIYICVLI